MARNKSTLREYLTNLRETRTNKYGIVGLSVSFDGMPGSGKNHQVERLKEELRKESLRVNVVRETSLVRSDDRKTYMEEIKTTKREDPKRSAALYTADRREAWDKHIIPLLQERGILVLDRSFYSTLAIQMLIRNINPRNNRDLTDLAEELLPEPIIPPNIALITICDPRIAYERAKARYDKSSGDLEDYFDTIYQTFYTMLNNSQETNIERMRHWWLRTNLEMYKQLKKIVPDSHIVRTGRKTEKLNPIIRDIITNRLRKQ